MYYIMTNLGQAFFDPVAEFPPQEGRGVSS